jgi:hypothetical protein
VKLYPIGYKIGDLLSDYTRSDIKIKKKMANKNNNLHKAKKNKNDEFYTLLSDIEKEMEYYKDFFSGKVVYCNCDDSRESNFFKYFYNKFEELGLKKLMSSGYKEQGFGILSIYEGGDNEVVVKYLNGNGDFRSDECIEFLKECDVVVTNPPFSLFRDYVSLVMKYEKQFLIIGNINAITYKEIFPYIRRNELWLGCSSFNSGMYFRVPDDYEYADTYKFDKTRDGQKVMRVSSICWYTNINHNRRNIQLALSKSFNTTEYPKYSNYDAIEVSKVENIPMGYDGVMGVPITFLHKYCPSQFEILGHEHDLDGNGTDIGQFEVNGKGVYKRILIRNFNKE